MRRPLGLLIVAVSTGIPLLQLGSRFPLPQRDLSRWLVAVGSADAAMSVIWLVALGAATYLALIALLHMIVPTWSRAGRIVARLTLPSLRALLVSTVLATSSAGAAFAGVRATAPPPVSIVLVEPDAAAVPVSNVPAPTYTVRPGDSFWSIAEALVTANLGRMPSVNEIGSYWHRLVMANSDRLVRAGNPDLIFSGQVLLLPQP